MWYYLKDRKIFSRIHIRYDRLINSKFFSDVYLDGWTSGNGFRETVNGSIFFYGYVLASIILIINLIIKFFLKVGDKHTFADYLHYCRTCGTPMPEKPFMTALSPEETSSLIPYFEFLDDPLFQLFFGCSLIVAKCFFFFFILFWCVFLFKFCAYGSTKEKAFYLADNFVSTRIYAFFYALIIFLVALLILFLMPGVDDFFIARQYIPPLRWVYVDFTSYFNGYHFYTERQWTSSRVWMPNTYGSHISYFFFHSPNVSPDALSPTSQFVVDLQFKTFFKEIDIYFQAHPRLNQIRCEQRNLFNSVHKDPSILYDLFETIIRIDKFICDEIEKFRKK